MYIQLHISMYILHCMIYVTGVFPASLVYSTFLKISPNFPSSSTCFSDNWQKGDKQKVDSHVIFRR